jgi:hypothetical protein
LCFPLAPHPRDVVTDFVVACVVAQCPLLTALEIDELDDVMRTNECG